MHIKKRRQKINKLSRKDLIKNSRNMGITVSTEDSIFKLRDVYEKAIFKNDINRIKNKLRKLNIYFSDNLSLKELKILLNKSVKLSRKDLINNLKKMGIMVLVGDNPFKLRKIYEKAKRENEIKRIKNSLKEMNVGFSDNLSLHKLRILLKNERNELVKKAEKEMLLKIVRQRKIQPPMKYIEPVYDDNK